MKDAISIQRLATLHPDRQDKFKSFIEELENTFPYTFRITQAFRSFAEQDALYAQGRTTAGKIVTNAKGGESFHCYGLAVDLVPLNNNVPYWGFDYSKASVIGEKYGLTWGGTWKDSDHFEDNLGYGSSGWRNLITMVQNKQVDDNGFVNIG